MRRIFALSCLLGAVVACEAKTAPEPPTSAQAPVGAKAQQPAAAEAEKSGGMLAVGAAAPAFTLPDQEGRSVSLADVKGKKALIWFYPKADTGG